MIRLFHESGQNSAMPPAIMNDYPRTGTIRTENAPPVATAVP